MTSLGSLENIIAWSRESRLPIRQIASVTPSGSNGAGDTSTSNPWKLHCFLVFLGANNPFYGHSYLCMQDFKRDGKLLMSWSPGRWAMLVVLPLVNIQHTWVVKISTFWSTKNDQTVSDHTSSMYKQFVCVTKIGCTSNALSKMIDQPYPNPWLHMVCIPH